MSNLNLESLKAFLDDDRFKFLAALFKAQTDKPFNVQTLTLDLSTAKLATDPMKISVPFQSLYVVAGTDNAATVNMRVNTRDTFQSAIPLKFNSSMKFPEPITEAYLDWSAQTGKTLTLLLIVQGEFNSGLQISNTSGAIGITEGTSFTTKAVTLAAATATQVAASDSTRLCDAIQNNTGADVWFGNASVSSDPTSDNCGQKVPNGGTFYWKNTAALYAYSVAGGQVNCMREVT